MAGLTTHVLDTAHGCPAAGMAVSLWRDGACVRELVLNFEGRAPLLSAEQVQVGRWQLRFAVADYFRARGVQLPDPPFLDEVSLDFGIADVSQHYHVPLLVSPWSYSTYRGS
jgi:5-hydroxyisourate hydrolase